MVTAYAKLVAKYPLAVLVCTSVVCISCILTVFLLTDLPEFSNPIKGFETRGTEISQRSLALKNLRIDLDHLTGQNNIFHRYPDEYELARNTTIDKIKGRPRKSRAIRGVHDEEIGGRRSSGNKILRERSGASEFGNSTPRPKGSVAKRKRIKVHQVDPRRPPAYCNTTPSQNGDEYAMLVFEVIDGSDLFSLSVMNDLCEIEHRLWSERDGETGSLIPRDSCQSATKRRCCQPWHFASVAAYLLDKRDCSQINETDVHLIKTKIDYCRQHAKKLARCWNNGDSECLQKIPTNCSSLPINLLYQYILPKEYAVPDAEIRSPPVTLMILPVAKMEYKDLTLGQIENIPYFLSTGSVNLIAMDFGVRDAVFQQYLLKDTCFGALALVLVFLAMCIYSGSFLFTLAAMIGIDLSICVAYFVYRVVFRIDFFPFMNILTYVLIVGVGADDAFIFRSTWRKAKFDKNSGTHAKILSDTLSHAAVSMFVTSLTTAAAFYTNIFSSIVVVKCFGIFAGTTILTNYVLVITWLPACVVLCEKRLVFSTSYCWFCPRWCIRQQRRHVHEQEKLRTSERRRSSAFATDMATHMLSTNSTTSSFCLPTGAGSQNHRHQKGDDDEPPIRSRSIAGRNIGLNTNIWFLCTNPIQRLYQQLSVLARVFFQKLLPWLVIKLRYFSLISFGSLAVLSAVAVFYSPTLKLPSREYFQYFKSSHPFERWEDGAKQRFAFASENNKVPLVMYVVWGVKPTRDAPMFDPDDTGSLEAWPVDNETDFYDNVNLIWFREFCSSMALQNFTHFQPLELPMLASCFVEDFMLAMSRRRCGRDRDQPQDYCCADVTFPYPPGVFETCLRLFVSMQRSTITLFDLTSGLGPSGPLFSSKNGKPTGLVVMFTSKYNFTFSYSTMHEFYESSNKWVTDRLNAGPDLVRNGWLIADHLQLYDLQRALTSGTRLSVLIALAIAFVVLFVTTWNPLISFLAILSISSIIVTTIAVLILLDWELNVLESTIIILTIGLSFDFTLHYGVAYKLCTTAEDRESRVVYALGEVGSPVFMAFITTFMAGAAMLPSTTLAYFQIGLFMMLETTISWLYATFFFSSLLHCIGPSGSSCQFNPRNAPCIRRGSMASPTSGTSRRISRDIAAEAALAAAARRKKSSIVSFNAVAFNSIACNSSPLPAYGTGPKISILTPLDYRRPTSSRDYTPNDRPNSEWQESRNVENEPMIGTNKDDVTESPEMIMSVEVRSQINDLEGETIDNEVRMEARNETEVDPVTASDDGATAKKEKKPSIKDRAASILGPMIHRFSSKKSSNAQSASSDVTIGEGEDVELCLQAKDEEDKFQDHTNQDVPFIDGDTSLQSINGQLR